MSPSESASRPNIDGDESFDVLVRKLSPYFVQQLDTSYTFEELRKAVYARHLKPLAKYLIDNTHHPAIVNALLALKWHFAAVDAGEDRGVSQTRGFACELVAWRFVAHLTDSEAIDCLCYDVPVASNGHDGSESLNALDGNEDGLIANESSPLLDGAHFDPDQSFAEDELEGSKLNDATSFTSTFAGLNALEIAAVADAKKFLSQKSIQRVVDGIWTGDIVFWETLGQHSKKQAKIYNKKRSDPFCRLRVPMYAKAFEVLFFAGFLAFYYTVLVQKSTHRTTGAETMLYIWLAAFAYNEVVEFWDAGSVLYALDFWSLWDLGIIAIGVTFLVVRTIGLAQDNIKLLDTAFDILSLEALFLVPRICSLLSLHPYFGTLIPCLQRMTGDFIQFLGLVAIFYVGFNTTFAFLARGVYSVSKMNWILIKVFFGSSYLGFDVAEEISPVLGPPLMFIFVCLTNILLVTSLISLLSNSLTKVMEHAREEYLRGYAVYVVESSASNRLTYFLPPLNLVPLLLRPLRLVVSAERLRTARIVLLKATHWPFVALILGWERLRRLWRRERGVRSSLGVSIRDPSGALRRRRPLSGRSYQHSLVTASNSHPQLAGGNNTSGSNVVGPLDRSPAASETMEALERAVRDLRNQADALETLMARQRSNAEAS